MIALETYASVLQLSFHFDLPGTRMASLGSLVVLAIIGRFPALIHLSGLRPILGKEVELWVRL
jgi:hypothetical protein